MKKGRVLGSKNNTFMFVFVLLLLVSIIAVGYFTGFFRGITGYTNRFVGVNITVGVASIIDVNNWSATLTPLEGISTSRQYNFTAYHGSGVQFLNESTATMNLTFVNAVGEVPRVASTCAKFSNGTYNITFTCNLTIWWFDGAGNWNLTATIIDNNSNFITNSSTTVYVGSTTGFVLSPNNLTWASLGAGATNQSSSNDPLVLNNTGNQPVGNASGTSNISVNATNLRGETNNLYSLYANNFSVGPITGSCPGPACDECGGGFAGNFSLSRYANMSNMTLPKGNYSVQDGSTGQEQMFFCLRIVGADLISQAYSTVNMSPWTVKIY